MIEYRYVIWANERPKKKQVVWATCIGAALEACKQILGPTTQPCAQATHRRRAKEN